MANPDSDQMDDKSNKDAGIFSKNIADDML